jgi:uncharacterized repeat protein (TIGR01451 family)
MRTYRGYLLTLLAATTALADTVDFDTTGSTLSCNGVTGCVQDTAAAVTIGGLTITYSAVSSTGVTVNNLSTIGLGSIAASGTVGPGPGTGVSGLQLALNIHSTPPGLSGTMPATLSGNISTASSSATIAFPPANSSILPLCMCFGIQLSGGGHDYLYQIQSSSWDLLAPSNSPTSFTGYVWEDVFTRLHPNANTTPQSAPINTAFPNALSLVALVDAGTGDVPRAGVTVTFNAPSSGATGLFSNNSTTTITTTDMNGLAGPSFTANATAGGPYTVVASGTYSGLHFPDIVFALTNTPVADLSATVNDGKTFLQGGKSALYTIVAHNAGPSDVVGATVTDLLPANLADGIWECTPDAGAACTVSGSGNINDSINLPSGKSVTYALSATVVAIPESAVQNTVTVTAPIGVPDSSALNNSATDVDNVGIFSSGFE